MKAHVLTETSYCASMYEHGKYRCTAAGRYMDTKGRVICARCAEDLVVCKLAEIPKLIQIIDQLLSSAQPITDDVRVQLRALVDHAHAATP